MSSAIVNSMRASAARDTHTGSQPHWYGWQIVLLDAIAVGTAIGGARSELAFSLAFYGYLASGPIVHWAHGRWGTGFGSLGLRFGLPAGLLLIASPWVFGCLEEDDCRVKRTIAGAACLGLGALGAIAIDVAFLAQEWEPDTGPVGRPASTWLQAGVTATPGQLGVVVRIEF